MPRKRPSGVPVPAALRELVDEFLANLIEQHGREAVEAAVTEALARRPGHPEIDDRAALEYMDKVLLSGKAKNPTDAANQALDLGLTEAHTRESAVRRLRDKYRKQRAEIAARSATGEAVRGLYDLYSAMDKVRRAFLEPGEKMLSIASEIAARVEATERVYREAMAGLLPRTEKK